MADILQKLKGGDRRSIGRADEVVEAVRKDPSLFKSYKFVAKIPHTKLRLTKRQKSIRKILSFYKRHAVN